MHQPEKFTCTGAAGRKVCQTSLSARLQQLDKFACTFPAIRQVIHQSPLRSLACLHSCEKDSGMSLNFACTFPAIRQVMHQSPLRSLACLHSCEKDSGMSLKYACRNLAPLASATSMSASHLSYHEVALVLMLCLFLILRCESKHFLSWRMNRQTADSC